MIEMAIVLPLLLVLLLAVGYFGHTVISMQNLHAGSRSAAREMALESTETPGRRTSGDYEPSNEHMLELAQGYLSDRVRPEQLLVRPQTRMNHDYNSLLQLEGRFGSMGGSEHRFAYVLSETVNGNSLISPTPQDRNDDAPGNLNSLEFGIGAAFYGGTLQYSLDELTPLSRFLFRADNGPAIKLGATSLMPAELPLRGSGYGLLSINPGLRNLVSTSVESGDYPDLID